MKSEVGINIWFSINNAYWYIFIFRKIVSDVQYRFSLISKPRDFKKTYENKREV